MCIHLRDIAFALPEQVVRSTEIAAWSGMDEEKLSNKIGVKERRFLQPGESIIDLVESAARVLFKRNESLTAASVDLLVAVTQNPEHRMPGQSSLIHERLELQPTTASIDLHLGCSGWVYAISVARALMLAEGLENALIVTADPYSRAIGKSDFDTIGLFGDAATVTWLSTQGAPGSATIGRADLGSDGSGWRNLMIPSGGAAQPISSVYGDTVADSPEDYRIKMRGGAIFNFMIKRVPESLSACLAKNGMEREAIDYFVFHQASGFLLNQLTQRLGLPAEKVPTNLSHYGNTVSSSIPLLLAEMLQRQCLPGKTVLVSGFGVGLSWASNILTFSPSSEP